MHCEGFFVYKFEIMLIIFWEWCMFVELTFSTSSIKIVCVGGMSL